MGEQAFPHWGGAVIAKNGRKAMEICETHNDQTIANVEPIFAASELPVRIVLLQCWRTKGSQASAVGVDNPCVVRGGCEAGADEMPASCQSLQKTTSKPR